MVEHENKGLEFEVILTETRGLQHGINLNRLKK
jgi:hypothetical protein